MTKRDEAYRLFEEGKDASSLEVKALGLKASTRYSYYSLWKSGKEPSSTAGYSPRKPKATAEGKVPLAGGESIGAISEILGEEPKEKTEKTKEEEGESREEEGLEETGGKESKGEEVEVPSGDGKKKIPTSILGEGLRVTVFLSVKTISLYQIAATMQAQHDNEDALTLGDFLDTCAEDFFRVRGKSLGLITVGGRK